MPYFTITDFAAGLDLRRSELTAPAGTMRSMLNAHVTPGGEIEKRMAFVPFWECSAQSKGLVEVNRKLYTFGPNGPYKTEPPDGTWSVGVLGQQCTSIYEIIDYDLFDNKVFVILWTAGPPTNTVMRFYDGIDLPAAKGFYCRTYKTKMYTVGGPILYFSAVGNPADWAGTGAGNIDLSLGDSDMTDSIALEAYYDKLAIFSRTAVQLWAIDPDPLKNTYTQTLRQAGTIAWRSVLQYGSGDVMYLSHSGIRSLRARNSSLAAAVSDIGSPLDPVIQDLFRYMGEDWTSGTIAILQPVTGRFWIIMPDRIYVLSSRFRGRRSPPGRSTTPASSSPRPPSTRTASWCATTTTSSTPSAASPTTAPVYDDCPVELIFPFHAGEQQLATFKTFTALDATCTGIPWEVGIALNVENPDAEDYVGIFDGPTFLQGKQEIHGHSTHMSLRLRSNLPERGTPGPQTLANLMVHYQVSESG